ncbi:monoamine oxidase [Bradyrhizobium sp. CIR48]|nr:monoamine oxidase [Bradyrhizobium sp. CIR48]
MTALKSGRGVLLVANLLERADSFEFTGIPPDERVGRAAEFGAAIHPQYRTEFENGIAVPWHRMPLALGRSAHWSDEARKQHYRNLCRIDGRILLAGELCRHCRSGRRARCSPHSMPSRGCTSG